VSITFYSTEDKSQQHQYTCWCNGDSKCGCSCGGVGVIFQYEGEFDVNMSNQNAFAMVDALGMDSSECYGTIKPADLPLLIARCDALFESSSHEGAISTGAEQLLLLFRKAVENGWEVHYG